MYNTPLKQSFKVTSVYQVTYLTFCLCYFIAIAINTTRCTLFTRIFHTCPFTIGFHKILTFVYFISIKILSTSLQTFKFLTRIPY